jgi:hypothetical protein
MYMFLSSCNDLPKTLTVCGEVYPIEYRDVHLDDEELLAKGAVIRNKETKEVMLGYFVEGKRNDTLFIKSEISISGDYVIRRDNYYFGISSSLDSTVATFKCTGKTLTLQSTKTYKNGIVIRTQTYDKE